MGKTPEPTKHHNSRISFYPSEPFTYIRSLHYETPCIQQNFHCVYAQVCTVYTQSFYYVLKQQPCSSGTEVMASILHARTVQYIFQDSKTLAIMFFFDTLHLISSLLVQSDNECMLHAALPKQAVNQFKPVHQSRKST